jgi:hypothetical protein
MVPNGCSTWAVEMLDDFYGKKRVRDPKMATELTKSFDPGSLVDHRGVHATPG